MINSPSFNEFLEWARDYGLSVEDWSDNEKVQFWAFFRYGWIARDIEDSETEAELPKLK